MKAARSEATDELPNQMDLRDKLTDEDREESDAAIERSAAEKEATRRKADRAETKYGGLIESGDEL